MLDFKRIVELQIQGHSLDDALLMTLKDGLGLASGSPSLEPVKAYPKVKAPNPQPKPDPALSGALKARDKAEAKEIPPPVTGKPAAWRQLGDDEVVKAGDEWRLAHGLSHAASKRPRWRAVGDSVGRRAGEFSKSIFRRKVV